MRLTGILIAVLIDLITVSLVAGSDQRVGFSFVCAKPGLPADVKPIITELMVKHHKDCALPWGDRAVSLPLHHGSPPTLFVPLWCDAAGNCTWAIVAGSPTRDLGVASAAVINTSLDSAEWPPIDGYLKFDASEQLETYRFSDDGYQHDKSLKLDPRLSFTGCLDNALCCTPEGRRRYEQTKCGPGERATETGCRKDAKLVSRKQPQYPAEALGRHVQACVMLEGTVGETGTPTDVKVLKSAAEDAQYTPQFEQAAIEAFQGWRYEPATLDKKPLATRVATMIAFSP